MAKAFNVDVVSPEATVWSGEATFVVARTTEGEIGIMADHEPVMAALATGAVKIESESEKVTIGVHGGFLQILNNQVTLLTDRAELSTGDADDARKIAESLRELEEGAE
ncbi:MAG TPA: F0F1 ATP synthase subunit epsilon [Acidimicrobiia bacterium]|nr:F0F1 ATP synthase subunit epsilon [Acidimicrobiia bacterium]